MSRLPLYPESHFVNRIGGAEPWHPFGRELIVGVAEQSRRRTIV